MSRVNKLFPHASKAAMIVGQCATHQEAVLFKQYMAEATTLAAKAAPNKSRVASLNNDINYLMESIRAKTAR